MAYKNLETFGVLKVKNKYFSKSWRIFEKNGFWVTKPFNFLNTFYWSKKYQVIIKDFGN